MLIALLVPLVLAILAVLAGQLRMRLALFFVLGLAGRWLRFAAVLGTPCTTLSPYRAMQDAVSVPTNPSRSARR